MSVIMLYDLSLRDIVQTKYDLRQIYAFNFPFIIVKNYIICNMGLKFLPTTYSIRHRIMTTYNGS